MNRTKASSVIALSAVAVLGLSACGGGTTGNNNGDTGATGGAATAGGDLLYLTKRPAEHLDPQRMYIGRDIFTTGRTVYRSLFQFPAGEKDATKAQTPIPDIATEVPTSSDGKTWTVTLKEGVKWQDGKDVVCEDFKYGVSRAFAYDVLDGGPFQYPTQYLDIPKDKDGSPAYKGPYSKKGQALFDKAVTCKGNEITYKFNKPWGDFPLAVAGLRVFDPYREDQDKGAKNNFVIFSNGPYKLDGTWTKGKGGKFVRNDQYDPKTDEGTRQANPDTITFEEGVDESIITDRIVAGAGNDANAITDRVVRPPSYSKVEPLKDQTTLVDSPYVFYLVPNMSRVKDVNVRKALATATDNEGWVGALGGDKAAVAATSIINPSLPGFQENPIFSKIPAAGDPAAAKKILTDAGVKMPYPIKLTYQGGDPTLDKAMGVIKEGWDKAGFKTSLDPLTETYYDIVNKPNNDSDVFQGGWGSDYPSAATVIPLLFDSRQLSASQVGNNYGQYKNKAVDQAIDKAALITDPIKAGEAYSAIDKTISEDYGYIPNYIQRFYFIRGKNVTGYEQTEATSMFADLGTVGVK
ncbi:ABC transporter substrate-binding protein [Kribbia dieselivorans]|uniref:ABC transporter substrate-binding protein n=1 Tax=Kribbia dieselivorans TaxID=331526 RepID=UPI000838F25D|nr:ABC transporter substrate-binding protein [Kribbia dieselivorans]